MEKTSVNRLVKAFFWVQQVLEWNFQVFPLLSAAAFSRKLILLLFPEISKAKLLTDKSQGRAFQEDLCR